VRSDGTPPTNLDPGFVSSFYIYPLARALAAKGFFHRNSAPSTFKEGGYDKVTGHIRKAYELYLEAASHIPEDDEMHVWFLNCALDNLFRCGGILRDTIPLAERVVKAIEPMKKIWEHSSLALGGRDFILKKTKGTLGELKRGLKDGEWTMNDPIMPKLDGLPMS